FLDESIPMPERFSRFAAAPGTETDSYSGTHYNGGWKNGRHHGYGVIAYEASRERYEGWFVSGKKNGHGKYFYANGDVFEGEFRNDSPHGAGSYAFANGGHVEGVWRNGLLWSGRGEIVSGVGARQSITWDGGHVVNVDRQY
ncbi:MAG: hypothetical protein IJ783_01450, partial [Kiritimatiellae bacterium]|nr:hypothetical protein [Kiritimatiellia bacterium]